MEHDLKQRLVGAIVITSLAAIFVPMLFDDPIDESSKLISELEIPVALGNSLKTDSTSLPKSTDDVITLPEAPALKEQLNRQQAVFTKNRWFIQVGIFGEKNNAIAQQNKIRQQGFPVTIATVSSEKGILYRVRVGPELDKKRAEAMKVKVDKLNNIKGILTFVDE
ncbi:MAG: SPOR domain-containing protein [Methylococcaceae bacterium]